MRCNQHVPHIAVPDGVSLEECEALKDWRGSKFFNEAERAALAYVDAMIAAPEVPDDVFNAVRKHYNEREIVELTVLVGTYLMHNRVFTALQGRSSSRRRAEGAAVPRPSRHRRRGRSVHAAHSARARSERERGTPRGLRRFHVDRRAGFRRLVRAGAARLGAASIRPRCGW